jgi:glyoxylase-like metal-dependent hydrolase (beta-lactamase superfamily II)
VSAPDVRAFTVGPVQENSYIVRASADERRAVIVDPGEEAERLLEAARSLGVEIEAILITHCHFDHIGAVAPVARATGAPVYCPEIERGVLADVMSWVPPGFGPFESWEAEHTVAGGERFSVAGLDVQVLFTPGHSPGHVTYAIAPSRARARESALSVTPDGPAQASDGRSPAADGPSPAPDETAPTPEGAVPTGEGGPPALLSGDVLFQGSVGRVDLPGGDWNVLERSIEGLVRGFPPQTVVYPGHMGVTTLGRELESNPFLSELRVRVPVGAASGAAAAGR